MSRYVTLLLVAMLALTSCKSSKQAAMNDLQELTSEIKVNATEYDFKEWRKVKNRYIKIEKKLAKHEYTAEENEEIGKMKGECLGYFAKGVLTRSSDKVMDAINQIQGLVDGLKKSLSPE